MTRRISSILVVLIALLLAACATRNNSSWSAKDAPWRLAKARADSIQAAEASGAGADTTQAAGDTTATSPTN